MTTTEKAQHAGAAEPLAKAYRPEEAEPRVRARWAESGAFHADPQAVTAGGKRPFAIVIPPPNVTGALHLGHALNNTLQDILIRSRRMQGFEALWMPGADHAGIATQTVVEKRILAPQGKKRTDYSRDEFVALVQEWKDEYEERIKGQLLAMGCSCDYDRWRFTMDEVCAKAVREAFFRLFKAGLIYRGKRLVNWDPVTQTALADDEVEMEEVEGNFYYLRYPLIHEVAPGNHSPVTWGELATRDYPGAEQHPEDQQAWITVATTRPETYLGDTAVAVNPRDPRAKPLKGFMCELPLVGRIIPILEDDYVVLPDPESSDNKAKFATGFLKVTPAHDPNDWELGRRHDLPVINVMAPDASISDQHGWEDVGDAHLFVGKSREAARKLVVEEFRARSVAEGGASLLEDIKAHVHSVGHSYRSHAAIEPYLSDQWYVKVTDDRLVGAAQRALGGTGLRSVQLSADSEASPGGTGLRPVPLDLHTESFPRIAPAGFIARDPYPEGARGPAPDLMGSIRNLPHYELEGATYFVTWATVDRRQLSDAERDMVLDAIRHWDGERCRVYLATVMPDHVHAVVRPFAGHKLGDWVGGVKKFTARTINEASGAQGHLWQDERFDHIVRDDAWFSKFVRYIVWNPVEAGLVKDPAEYRWTVLHDEVVEAIERPTHRSESGATRESPWDGRLHIIPDRYAKMYEAWHDNLRDWCISRQLWWGHRIPVWSTRNAWLRTGKRGQEPTRELSPTQLDAATKFYVRLRELQLDSRVAIGGELDGMRPGQSVEVLAAEDHDIWVCVRDPDDTEVIEWLENHTFVQDEDVLDTWFSSALWPLSTMGWPEPSGDTEGLIDAFNPTSVLSTAREILTLWVSRMVMFNRFFTEDDAEPGRRGRLPFEHVYIHAVVQDGEGKRMSKSAGNGVDPLDIIETHGADAMRYTLCQMTTQTQDVRMPVERDEASGRNTSPKFDLGKRFCNKLWNASRFTMMMLAESESDASDRGFAMIDHWMQSRLADASATINRALETYQFSAYADAVYDLLWRDFCDWYLEGVKPTVKGNTAQQRMLRASLDAILRLLHPVCPFVTESIYEALAQSPDVGPVDGVTLGAIDHPSGLLCRAPWPEIDASLRDEALEAEFDRLRALITQIRDVRAQQGVPPRTRITLHAPKSLADRIASAGGLVETMAGLEAVTTGEPEGASTPFPFEGAELRLSGLAGEAGGEGEKQRLARQIEELSQSIGVLDKRLANPGYTDKAPAHLVQQTRDQRDGLVKELETAKAALGRLG
jgi:valyl-tRNA synthetase